jgi:hypothetical protein
MVIVTNVPSSVIAKNLTHSFGHFISMNPSQQPLRLSAIKKPSATRDLKTLLLLQRYIRVKKFFQLAAVDVSCSFGCGHEEGFVFGGPFGGVACEGEEECVGGGVFVDVSPEVFGGGEGISVERVVFVGEGPG